MSHSTTQPHNNHSRSRAIEAEKQNDLAKYFASLHRPGDPVMLGNVYDGGTAKIVSSHSSSKAIATASYGVAETYGLEDDDLTLDLNLQSIKTISSVVNPTGKPLTVDIQDGYDDIRSTIREVILLGAVGCNVEDVVRDSSGKLKLRDIDDAVERIKLVKDTAKEMGVSEFVVNARTDTLIYGGEIEEVITRGEKYLQVGATTVFVWGGSKRGLSSEEIQSVVKELNGKVSVKMNLREGFLKPKEIAQLGVARVSVGPELYLRAMTGFREGVEWVFGS